MELFLWLELLLAARQWFWPLVLVAVLVCGMGVLAFSVILAALLRSGPGRLGRR